MSTPITTPASAGTELTTETAATPASVTVKGKQNQPVQSPLPDAPTSAAEPGVASAQALATPEHGKALAELEKALAAASEPGSGIDAQLADYADILRYIGAVLIRNADAMRQSALSDRMAAREAARGALLGQSQKLHEAAETAKVLAIVCVAVVAAMSLMSISASAFALRNSFREIGVEQQKARDLAIHHAQIRNLDNLRSRAADPETEQRLTAKISEIEASQSRIGPAAEEELRTLRQRSRVADVVAQASGAGSNVLRSVEGVQQARIRSMEADAMSLGADAQYDQQHAEVKKDLYDKVIDLIQQSINLYRNMQHAQAEAMRAITRS